MPTVASTSLPPDLARDARRLALVIPGLGGGGAERILTGLANRWSAAGAEVTIVTLDADRGCAYPLDPSVRRVGLGVVRDSRNPVEGIARAIHRIAALRRALLEVRPSAVVSFIRSTNVLTLLATAGTGLPVVVSERTDPRLDPGARRQPAWAALRRLLYPRAAGVVVQTQSVARWARGFCSRVHVIPNFVERPPGPVVKRTEDGPKRLVAVGRLGPEKGFDLLLDAFARVARRHGEWSLTILGEGAERGRLEARVRALGLEDRVALPGRADPFPHLAAAHVFVLSSRREGFPNALLEAMASGLAVVAFDCRSGPGEIIRQGVDGLLVPDGDVAQLAAALDSILGDAEQRRRLGDAARRVTEVFDPHRIWSAWDELVRRAEHRP